MDITILKGDIINTSADTIVLPANSKLKEGSGASRAIFSAAGRKNLTEVCKNIGYCEVGVFVNPKVYQALIRKCTTNAS